MDNALEIIGTNIAMWWSFMWETQVPGTRFSFGALWSFVLVVSMFTFLVGIAVHKHDKED